MGRALRLDPGILTGYTNPLTLIRSRCAAGHKAMWHPDFDGLPSEEFLVKLDPLLKGIRANLYKETYTCDVKVGNLCAEWAKKLGLPESVSIGAGSFDAHLGAIGGEIKPYFMSKVMGTSTCDMLVAPMNEVGDKAGKRYLRTGGWLNPARHAWTGSRTISLRRYICLVQGPAPLAGKRIT